MRRQGKYQMLYKSIKMIKAPITVCFTIKSTKAHNAELKQFNSMHFKTCNKTKREKER